MPNNRPGLIRRLFTGLWTAVDTLRRFVLNAVFLAVLLLVAAALWGGGTRLQLLGDTALVIDIKGELVEQYTGSAREAQIARSLDGKARETQVRDLVAVLDAAAKDARITRAALLLDDMGTAGMAKLREVAAAMDRFKAGGKKIVAWAGDMDQKRYFLAAHASEVYLHPMGAVALTGFGGYRNYYHDALERLGVTVNVFRAGKYKSFVEPFVGNGPSPEAAQAEAFWLNDAWAGYTREIEAARHLPEGTVAGLIARAPELLAQAHGDLARLALDARLVDGLKTRDEIRALFLSLGKPDEQHKTFRQVAFDDYLAEVAQTGDARRQVGIIVAEGTISDGEEPQGAIGGASTSALIRAAREDDSIKALVLRVDSGGGSAFGSELIRRELELTRQAGKPVVVSMSDVAASGGYWITTAADRVFADPGTITGSIGVFGIFPSVERGLDKLGIHTAGTTTTWLAGQPDPRRAVDPRLAQMFQLATENVYRNFLERVAQARKSTPERVNDVAQGRVWTGNQARERGLVDELGGLQDAVRAAAQLAQASPGYRVAYLEAEPSNWLQLLSVLPRVALKTLAAAAAAPPLPVAVVDPVWRPLRHDLAWLAKLPASFQPNTYAHCLCAAP